MTALIIPRGNDRCLVHGSGVALIFGEDGKFRRKTEFTNKITQNGDQYYAEGGRFAFSSADVTGMQLGTGSTAPSKTGGGAAIVTYISGSSIGFDSTWPKSSLVSTSRQFQYRTTWATGVATNGAILEAVIHNQSLATNSGAPVGNTIARLKFGASLNKAADEVLVIVWNHVFEGT